LERNEVVFIDGAKWGENEWSFPVVLAKALAEEDESSEVQIKVPVKVAEA
jgi:hypothetical protein